MPPTPLLRKRHIIRRLRACGATSPETAKTLAEAGVFHSDWFKPITNRLVKTGIIKKTADDRYYI